MSKNSTSTIEPVGKVIQYTGYPDMDIGSAFQCASVNPITAPDIVRITNLRPGVKVAVKRVQDIYEQKQQGLSRDKLKYPEIPGYAYGSSSTTLNYGPQYPINYEIINPIKFKEVFGQDEIYIDIFHRLCYITKEPYTFVPPGTVIKEGGYRVGEEIRLNVNNPCGTFMADIPHLHSDFGNPHEDLKQLQFVVSIEGWVPGKGLVVLDQTVITATSLEIPPMPPSAPCVAPVAATIQQTATLTKNTTSLIDTILSGSSGSSGSSGPQQGNPAVTGFGFTITSPLPNSTFASNDVITISWTVSDATFLKFNFGTVANIGITQGTFTQGPTQEIPQDNFLSSTSKGEVTNQVQMLETPTGSTITVTFPESIQSITASASYGLIFHSDTKGTGYVIPITINPPINAGLQHVWQNLQGAVAGGRRKKTRKAKKAKAKASRRR